MIRRCPSRAGFILFARILSIGLLGEVSLNTP
jgi:hypothetical protein